jgi:FkbM family methyltransferase
MILASRPLWMRAKYCYLRWRLGGHHGESARWFRDNGDYTLRLDYPLSERSVVFDVGGYKGDWSYQIVARYNPTIHIFEPVPEFRSFIATRYGRNHKIRVHPFGLWDVTGEISLSVDEDRSSIHGGRGPSTRLPMMDVAEFIDREDVSEIDLIKINIEGAEYRLLARLIDSGLVVRCKNIQIQFHRVAPDSELARKRLTGLLAMTHSLVYDYPFVWESWKRI